MNPRTLVLSAWFLCPTVAGAQRPQQPLEVRIPSTRLAATDRPTIATAGTLSGAKIQELMRFAFPAHLHYRLELWRKNALFDDLEAATEWDVVVAYDPAVQRYRVRRQHGAQSVDLGSFTNLEGATAAAERPYRVLQIGRGRPGNRYYYSARLEVRALQVSDLDALQGWLRGQAQPALQGRKSPFTAIRNGIGTMVSRVIGGDRRTYDARSAVFVAG